MMRYGVVLAICIGLTSCHPKPHIKNKMLIDVQIEAIAKEKYDGNFILTPNSKNTFTIISQKTKAFADFGFDISYFLIDNSTGEILIEDFLKSGHVSWESDYVIKVIDRALDKENTGERIIKTYTFDVLKRQKEVL